MLLPGPEFGVEVLPYPIQQRSKFLAVPGLHAGEHRPFGPLPATGYGTFERPPLRREVDAQAPGVLHVGPALHEAARFEPPQHLRDGRWFDAQAVGELAAP